MDKSRITNTKRILSSGILNRLIHTLLPFINRTIIIHTLGSEFTGLTGLFTSILQVLSLAEFGFNTAVVYSLYEPLAKDDKSSVNQILSWLRRIYHIVGSMILIAGIAAAPFLPHLIHGSYPDSINIYVLFLLYLFNSGISYFLFAYKEALLVADQKKDIATNIKSAVTLLVQVMQYITLLLFRNFYLYIATLIFGTMLSNILVNRAVKARYPYPTLTAESTHLPPAMKKQLAGLLINRLSNISRNAFDSLIISSTLGLVATTIYDNYYMVYSAVFGFTDIVSNSMQASVGNSMVMRGVHENFENLLDFSLLYSWIIGWCAVTMACLYQPFMKLWVGTELMLPNRDMLLFAGYFYLINMNHIRNQYIYGKGMWWEMKWSYLLESIGNLTLNIILGKLFGITGVLIATILTIFFCNYLMCNAVLFRVYFKGESIRTFYRQQFYYLVIALFTGVLTYLICMEQESIILRGVICLILPNTLLLLLYRFSARWKSSLSLLQRTAKQ